MIFCLFFVLLLWLGPILSFGQCIFFRFNFFPSFFFIYDSTCSFLFIFCLTHSLILVRFADENVSPKNMFNMFGGSTLFNPKLFRSRPEPGVRSKQESGKSSFTTSNPTHAPISLSNQSINRQINRSIS